MKQVSHTFKSTVWFDNYRFQLQVHPYSSLSEVKKKREVMNEKKIKRKKGHELQFTLEDVLQVMSHHLSMSTNLERFHLFLHSI